MRSRRVRDLAGDLEGNRMSKNMQAEVTSAVSSAELEQDRRDRRRRKVAAILAGGLVLGVGAGVTLAAWSDSEFATGTFTSGTFDLEGSTDGTNFSNHTSSAGAAALSFSVPLNNLAPGNAVYAPLSVRLAAGTTSAAALKLSSIETTDVSGTNSLNLSYAVYKLASATTTCDATNVALAGAAIASEPVLTSSTTITSGTVPLAIGSPVTNAGATERLCIVVTAGAGLEQGRTTTSVWQFSATSNN